MKTRNILMALVVATLTLGCAGTKDMFGIAPDASGTFFLEPFAVEKNTVSVYVYRPKGYAYQPDVYINGVSKSLLAPGAYLHSIEKTEKIQVLVQKNPNTGNWNFNPIGLSVNAKFGERRYFRISAGLSSVLILPIGGGVGYKGGIEEVPESIALIEMKKTRSMR
jgi:hypothetical protein